RERLRPAQGQQPKLARAACDLAAKHVRLPCAAEGSERIAAGQLARQHRPPLGRPGKDVQHALGRELGQRARQVEVEARGPIAHEQRVNPTQTWIGPTQPWIGPPQPWIGPTQPWISQPSVARPASITASESVGWPWTMRATSAKPPSR